MCILQLVNIYISRARKEKKEIVVINLGVNVHNNIVYVIKYKYT